MYKRKVSYGHVCTIWIGVSLHFVQTIFYISISYLIVAGKTIIAACLAWYIVPFAIGIYAKMTRHFLLFLCTFLFCTFSKYLFISSSFRKRFVLYVAAFSIPVRSVTLYIYPPLKDLCNATESTSLFLLPIRAVVAAIYSSSSCYYN